MGSDSSLVRTNGAGNETGSVPVDDRSRAESSSESGAEARTGSGPTGRARSKQQSGTTDPHTYACPLCGFTDETRETVYDHLLCSHRKRAISSALLEARSNRE